MKENDIESNFIKELDLCSTIKKPVKLAFFVPQHYVCYIDINSEATIIGTTGLADCIGLAVYNSSYGKKENNYKLALAHLDDRTTLKSIEDIFAKMRVNDEEHLELTLVGGHEISSGYFAPLINYIKKLQNVSVECKLFPSNKALNTGYQKLIVDIFGSVDTISSNKEIKLLKVMAPKFGEIEKKIGIGEVFDLEPIEFLSKEFDREIIALGETGGFMPLFTDFLTDF